MQSRIRYISAYLDSEKVTVQVEPLSSVGPTIGRAVCSLTSGQPVKIVSGTLDVISALTAVILVNCPVTSTMFSLIETIL